MNVGKPPLGSSRSTTTRDSESARRASSYGSNRKSPRRSTSDSPSGSASNAHGRSVVNRRLRSVLSHPLGLPLCYVLRGKNPSTLSFLGKDSSKEAFLDGANAASKNHKLDAILKTAVEKWVESFPSEKEREEPQLTKLMSTMINEQCNSIGFHSAAEVAVSYENRPQPSRIDILFSPQEKRSSKEEESSTPLALIEVGRHDLDWWKKLDQNFKYLVNLGAHQKDNRLRVEKPLLLAVLTIEGEAEVETQQLRVKLGVFLCSPWKDPETHHCSDFRMTLLSHFDTESLQDASRAFGHLLRATSLFSQWRESGDEAVGSYEYFSSNCCKVGQYVLRSYDSRFRPTNRSPEIYLSPECRDIIGGEPAREVAKFPEDFNTTAFNHGDNDKSCDDSSFWSSKSLGRGLLIIATPYRDGGHVAKSAKAFLPVIAQLELLHNKGFVHGDIRAFNTVFGENNEGWLIDFDFGGRIGATCYPNGYRRNLDDGTRIGREKEKIEKWHDWYALGQLIFTIHDIMPPNGINPEHAREYLSLLRFWTIQVATEPSEIEKEELKSFLSKIDEQGWQVRLSQRFQIALKDNLNGPISGTDKGATGSPPGRTGVVG